MDPGMRFHPVPIAGRIRGSFLPLAACFSPKSELTFPLVPRNPPMGPLSHVPGRGRRNSAAWSLPILATTLALAAMTALGQPPGKEKLYLDPLGVEPKPITADATVKVDYDIV